ncbi:hypothetical protein [Rhodococcus sp. NPDC058514]|uniref:hypothetical protein n=1 Tax=unclassified Rhodococcus (in: high G+C Gram-positive bacteria) TaxID=192944 RepID=UPI003652A822
MVSQSSPRDTALLRAALVFFFVGVLAIVAIFVVAATGREPGLALYLTALACPVGFLLGIVFALRSGRRVRREGQQ